MYHKACTLALLLMAPTLSTGAVAAELDQQSGLIKDDNWELVRSHCAACHSLKLVTSNRADRQTWLETIRWMQKTQNLWQFTPDTEDKILSYLAKNYAPTAQVRRQPIPPHLMPK